MNYTTDGVLTPLNVKQQQSFASEADRVRKNLENNKRARKFLTEKGFSIDELLGLLGSLQAFDGERSNLAVSECGIIKTDDVELLAMPLNLAIIKKFPGVLACTGIEKPETRANVYFFGSKSLQAMHILHELLHAASGKNDPELAAQLGFTFPDGDESKTGELSFFLARECIATF